MKKWILLTALLAVVNAVPARAPGDLEDAPPLVKASDEGEKKTRPTPEPTPTVAAEAEETTAPAGPTRVGPPPKTETPEEVEPENPVPPPPTEEKSEEKGAPRPVEDLKDAPPLVPKDGTGWMEHSHPLFGGSEASLLLVSSRLDVAFLAGGSVQQGFTLPSVRLTAAGSTGEVIHYRLSLGQTREFSSAQLPQITPVEAFVEFHEGEGGGSPPVLLWRIGMFTPDFNPWWTPDLSEVALPDYHEIDRALLLSRDLGAQLTFRPFANHLKISAGVFNGNGIVALNTNSSRAFNGNMELNFGTDRTSFGIGGAVYRVQQAGAGSVNFRSDTMGSLYADLNLLWGRLRITGELLSGQLQDSTRSAYPLGVAGTLDVGLWTWGRLFGRAEALQNSGTGSGNLHHFQLGPVLEFSRNVDAWLLYDYLDSGPGAGTPQQQGLIRLRLSV